MKSGSYGHTDGMGNVANVVLKQTGPEKHFFLIFIGSMVFKVFRLLCFKVRGTRLHKCKRMPATIPQPELIIIIITCLVFITIADKMLHRTIDQ